MKYNANIMLEKLLVMKGNKHYRKQLQKNLQKKTKNATLIDKYDFLTGKEIKPFDQSLICTLIDKYDFLTGKEIKPFDQSLIYEK